MIKPQAFIIAAALTACQTNIPKTIERGNKSIAGAAPGTVIHQSVRELENGFYDVSKSVCLLYTSPSPRDQRGSRMPSSA